MDNLTHTLAGMLIGEAAAQWRSRTIVPSRAWRTRAFVGSCVANNLPDADFLYKGITSGRLGYLLHHRGHTHTVLAALLIGLATFAAVSIGTRMRARGDRASLLVVCAVGPLVHIAMDFSNSYGVHPFWPLYDGWLYGDAVFIVEPWFWVAAIPPLAWSMHRRLTRTVLWSFLMAVVVAAWTLGLVSQSVALALTVGAVGTTWIAAGAAPHTRVALAVLGSWLVALVFGLASASARTRATRSLAAAFDHLDDVVLTPLPGDPRCFDALAVGTRGGLYVARRGTIAPLAPLSPRSAEGCRDQRLEPTTAQMLPLNEASEGGAVHWQGQWTAPADDLAALARERCEVAALLRFVRAPYWMREGDVITVGDLRYDRAPGLDFADVALTSAPSPCPRAVPPWIPPRHRLLRDAP